MSENRKKCIRKKQEIVYFLRINGVCVSGRMETARNADAFLCAPMAKPERKDIPVARKRLTQRFPFLLPLRRWQRKFCFYLKMRLDKKPVRGGF